MKIRDDKPDDRWQDDLKGKITLISVETRRNLKRKYKNKNGREE